MRFSKQQLKWARKLAGMFPPPPILRMAAPGIDISDEAVRYVDLVDTGRGKELSTFGTKPLDPGVLNRGQIRKKDELIKVIKEIAKENDFKFVRSSLPDERAYLFQTQVDAGMDPEEIRTMIEFNLEEYVPVSSEEAIFDYMPMASVDGQEQEGKMNISVSVFSKKVVDNYIDVFEKVGLSIFSLETNTQAISRAVIPTEDEDNGDHYMLVNFGELRTNLAIVYKGVVVFTSTLEIGGKPIDEAIQKHYSVPLGKVQDIKDRFGLIGNKDKKELFFSIMSTVSALKDEMNKHLSYWRSRMNSDSSKASIKKIVLCGENAGLAGLREYIQESMGISTERGDVWKNAFSVEELMPSLQREDSYFYSTAIGLALRREGKE